ncbi:MAG: hypothetical protein IBJ10_05360 [Phycisphaerales bacterium]|nr:hypothetical protein [Phycisphaerales bacterium]
MRPNAPAPDHDLAAQRVHRVTQALTVLAAVGGVAGVLVTGRYAPAFLTDIAFGAIFAVECVVVERWTRDALPRRSVRSAVRAAWGLTFVVWSALMFTLAARALRALGVTNVDPDAGPKQAHASLETHLEAAAVYVAVVVLASACTALVLSVRSDPRRYWGPVARGCAWACGLGGLGVALGFPERPWIAALGACSGGAVWHAIVGAAIFSGARAAPGSSLAPHSRTGTANDTGLR